MPIQPPGFLLGGHARVHNTGVAGGAKAAAPIWLTQSTTCEHICQYQGWADVLIPSII